MMQYRKKSVVVDAKVWMADGDHPQVRLYRNPDVPDAHRCEHCGHVMHIHGWIDTLEGGHIVCPRDWIITGVVGEVYPCKPNIFEMTYEAVVELTPGVPVHVEMA